VRRREFLRGAAAAAAAAALSPWERFALAAEGPRAAPGRIAPRLAATAADRSPVSPYGPLLDADANGLRLPAGFSSRVVARSNQEVPGTGYTWHWFPDGGATFGLADGGWAYVSNSELFSPFGGAGSIRFAPDGRIVAAARILSFTDANCAGGATPWGTWLSCEERARGLVWECHPLGHVAARPRPALGRFQHEAAAFDPAHATVYLTEDEADGGFYRFRYPVPGDLRVGTLEIATVQPDGSVAWTAVPDPTATRTPTRRQVASTPFGGGEGIWFHDGQVFFATEHDNRIWRYDVATRRVDVLYDAARSARPVLAGIDDVVVSAAGEVLVSEDGGDLQLVLLTDTGTVAPLLQIEGHEGSELTGPAFSPGGDRLYVSSQRGNRLGITYEVRGPFAGAA